MQIHVQKLLTKNENDIKKGGAAAAEAKRVKDIYYGLKYVTDQKCKGKFLRHFANLGEGLRGPRGAGVPNGVGRPGAMESRGVSLTLFLDQFRVSMQEQENNFRGRALHNGSCQCEQKSSPL